MASITTTLSPKKDKITGKSEILIRFVVGSRINQRAKSNIFIESIYWNNSEQHVAIPKFRLMNEEQQKLVTELQEADSTLSNLKLHISNAFNEAGAGKTELPKDWLKNVVKDFYNLPINSETDEEEAHVMTFFEVFDDFINKVPVSENRRRHYRVVYRALQRYEAYSKIKLTFDNFTSEKVKGFEDYLDKEFDLYESKKLDKIFELYPESRKIHQRGFNYVHGMLKKLRSFCNYASGRKRELPIDKPYLIKNPFDTMSIGAEIPLGTPYFITNEERNKLYHAKFGSERLSRQRDIFIFQCLVGCRVSDLMRLTWDNVVGDELHYIPSKTCENNPATISIPLHHIAKEIIEKYKDENRKSLLPFVAQQQYNEDIKEMLTMAEITRKVVIIDPKTGREVTRNINEIASSHMARRTFIGNLYNKVKDPNLIGSMSGHVNGSKAFSRYRAIDKEAKRELVSMLD